MLRRPTLDWHIRKDPHSLSYLVRDHFSTDKPLRNRTWSRRWWLDQGNEGACTGFGLLHTLLSTPTSLATRLTALPQPPADTAFLEILARQAYYENRRRDEWAGENYEGSSVTGAMNTASFYGWIRRYYWAKTLQEIQHGVSHHGPMQIGVNWKTGMFNTDSGGFIHATGRDEGGHSLEIGGISLRLQAFLLYNSWGKDWGINGNAWISFDDMNLLLEEQGEFALPVR